MELAKMVNIVFVMEGEDILGNAHTMDAIIIYLGANFAPNTIYYWEKECCASSGHSTTGQFTLPGNSNHF